jgi:hypothetical protein
MITATAPDEAAHRSAYALFPCIGLSPTNICKVLRQFLLCQHVKARDDIRAKLTGRRVGVRSLRSGPRLGTPIDRFPPYRAGCRCGTRAIAAAGSGIDGHVHCVIGAGFRAHR